MFGIDEVSEFGRNASSTVDVLASDLMRLNHTVPSFSNETLEMTSSAMDDAQHLPNEMTFNDAAYMSVIVYCVLFVIAACGNLTVFITLFRNRHRRSRVNKFILHLSIADLIVTFVMLPLEIAWHVTVAWLAGDIACRIFMFFRALGFYLSSFILVTISLDRYFAILHPLSLNDADKRGRIMLVFAWLFSVVASIPQTIIFHVEYHPQYQWFAQCVTFNFFPTPAHELAYNLFNLIAVYGLPLVVIIISYTLILCEMTKKSRESKASSMCPVKPDVKLRLRRSGVGRIERARVRTLKMTIIIVVVFILCWTPYFLISAWWWFDRKSADTLDPKIQKGLFLFAVSNSCMDPLVYGMFTINFKKEFSRCCSCFMGPDNRYRVVSAQYVPTRSDTSLRGHGRTNVVRLSQNLNDKNIIHFAHEDSPETTSTSTPERHHRKTVPKHAAATQRKIYNHCTQDRSWSGDVTGTGLVTSQELVW